MSKHYIEIFDGHNMIGVVETDNEFPGESVIELIDATIKGEKVVILHLMDMDYGMIIPNHIADDMKDIIRRESRNEN